VFYEFHFIIEQILLLCAKTKITRDCIKRRRKITEEEDVEVRSIKIATLSRTVNKLP
jgi:hypothetical protein